MRSPARGVLVALVLAVTSCSSTSAGSPIAEAPDPSGATVDEQTSDEAAKELVAEVDQLRQEAQVPGASVAVVHDGQILALDGLGVLVAGADDEVTGDTLFHIGSTQKAMTSMLVATMVDDGLIRWDQPLVEVTDELQLSDPEATDALTVRHLLSMTSGIPDEAEDELADGDLTPTDVFDLAAQTELLGEPGEEFSYSNVSSSLAGYGAVLAAGADPTDLYAGYERELQERILDPVGMSSATMSVEEVRTQPNVASPHVRDGDEVLPVDSEDRSPDALAPSGALKASAQDMAQFLIAQASGGIAASGTRVVSEAALAETWRSPLPQDGPDYGLGWDVGEGDEAGVLSHEGSFDNYTSVMVVIPEVDAGFVLLTNVDDADQLLTEARAAFVAYAFEQF